MRRIALTEDGQNGYWFDADKAEMFKEDTYWNGQNHISKATDSQWVHETLFLTASKKWIKMTDSNYAGTRDQVEIISENEAAEWFLSQEMDLPLSLEKYAEKYEI